jgi:hypothetical protein
LNLRLAAIRAFAPSVCLLPAFIWTAVPSFAQQTAQQTQAPATAAPAPGAKAEPDYPDPRSVVLSLYYLWPLPSGGPDIKGGEPAAQQKSYETLLGIGQYRPSVAGEIGVPITRTGVLYFDYEHFTGVGDQTLTRDTTLGTSPGTPYSYSKGDYVTSNYSLKTGRLYLDDLLYPHKFPVAKLRFRSIWAIRYLAVHTTTQAPLVEAASGGVAGQTLTHSDDHIFWPEFGAAMEYALAPHVLFRIDGAGFGWPGRSYLAETSANIAFRHKHAEFVVGIRTFKFKTSPKQQEYVSGSVVAGYGGLRWYW